MLTTDPVNVRFHKITNSIYLERPLNDARVQMTLSADGVLEGYLAGYTPVEEIYDFQYALPQRQERQGRTGRPQTHHDFSDGPGCGAGPYVQRCLLRPA